MNLGGVSGHTVSTYLPYHSPCLFSLTSLKVKELQGKEIGPASVNTEKKLHSKIR